MLGLKSARSTALGFLGMKMILASLRCFGNLLLHIIKLKILTRILTGTARNCFCVRPSRPGVIDKSSLAAYSSRCDWIPNTVERWSARTKRNGSLSWQLSRRANGIPFSPWVVAECLPFHSEWCLFIEL